MNKKATLTLTSLIGVSAFALASLFLTRGKAPQKVIGDASVVEHTIVFGAKNIQDMTYDSENFLYEGKLVAKTDAGNTFSTEELKVYDWGEEAPEIGTATDPFLFKFYQAGWPYYADDTDCLTVFFEMNLDIEDQVEASATWTTYYDDGTNQSTSTNTSDFDMVTEDNMNYLLEYTFSFDGLNPNIKYATIDALTIQYSCSY